MKIFFGLLAVVLSLFISTSICDEKENGNSLAKQILQNLDTQQFKNALQQFIEENNLDLDNINDTTLEGDEEILEALASAVDSLSSAHENLETVAKRYLVKIHRPNCGLHEQCMQFRGRRQWQKCTCPYESSCKKVGPYWKVWKCVY